MKPARERCPKCNAPVVRRSDDILQEDILVAGKAVLVAIQLPGLDEYTATLAERVHVCRKRRTP